MSIVNRRSGGNLMKLCSLSELESMQESDDIDTQQAAEAELKRREEAGENSAAWDELHDVW